MKAPTAFDSAYLLSPEFAAKAPLYKTARAVISCAQFGAGEYVSIVYSHRNANGVVWFTIDKSEKGKLAHTVSYPAHHLEVFCL